MKTIILNKDQIHNLLNTSYQTKLTFDDSINSEDKRILEKYLLKNSNNKINDILESIKSINSLTSDYSNFTCGLESNLNKSNNANPDSSNMNGNIKFSYKKFHRTPYCTYYFLTKKNSIQSKMNYNFLKTTDKAKPIKEATLSYGNQFTFDTLKNKRHLTLSTMFNNDISLDISASMASEYTEYDSLKKSKSLKLKLMKSFHPQPFIFKSYPYFDSSHYVSLEFQKSLLNNNRDMYTSRNLIDLLPEKDTCRSIGIVYKKDTMNLNSIKYLHNKPSDELYNIKLSLKHKQYKDKGFFNLKFFYRKFFMTKYLLLQSNFESNNIIVTNPDLDNSKLAPHQKIHITDFKGIKSLADTNPKGYYALDNWKKNNFNHTSGFMSSYKWYNKLYILTDNLFCSNDDEVNDVFNINPYFGKAKQQLLPFIHFNLMVLPNNTLSNVKKQDVEGENNNGNLADTYYSAGVGVTYLTEYISLEAFYNGFVKKNKNDLTATFGVNVGLD